MATRTAGATKAIAKKAGSSTRRVGPSTGDTLGASQPSPQRRRKTPITDLPRRYVGIDLHRWRSVIVKMTEDGSVLETTHVENHPLELLRGVTSGGEELEVALEATYGWVGPRGAAHDRAGGRTPPVACRSRSLKLEAA